MQLTPITTEDFIIVKTWDNIDHEINRHTTLGYCDA